MGCLCTPSGKPYLSVAWTLALLFALLTCAAQAHERDYYFGHIGSGQGLAQNTIGAILQGDHGYIWLGTQGGLHRYDGYSLKRFHHDASRTDSLPDNVISALASDGRGHLWVASKVGSLVLFDPSSNRVLPIPGNWASKLSTVTALAGGRGKRLLVAQRDSVIAVDHGYAHAKVLWRASQSQTLSITRLSSCANGKAYALHDQALIQLGADAAHSHVVQLDIKGVHSLLCLRNGHVLLGADSGLYRVDPSNGTTTRIWPTDATSPPGTTTIDALTEDHAGRIWAAVIGSGLLRLSANEKDARLLQPHPEVRGSLFDENIERLYVDQSGLVWTGTATHGASYFDPDGTPFRFVMDDQSGNHGVATNNIRAIKEDDSGRLWLGLGGAGLHRYDPDTGEFRSFTPALLNAIKPSAPQRLGVYAIVGNGNPYWLGTDAGVIRLDVSSGKARQLDLSPGPEVPIRTVLLDPDGSLWAGMYDGSGVVHYRNGKVVQRLRHEAGKPDHSLASGIVVALARDRSGRIWIGTSSGLSVYNPGDRSIRTFHEKPGVNDSLSSRVVMSLFIDHRGTLWVGTQSGLDHLMKLDASGAHFKRLTSHDGLPDATIYCLREDLQHRLWMSTNRGVVRYDPASGKITPFSVQDGLQGMEYNTGACIRTRDGSIVFGGVNGFDRVQPSHVKPSTFEPRVNLTGIFIGAKSHSTQIANDQIRMPQSARAIRFDFAAMDFAAPGQNRFKHRLVGFDKDWIDDGTRHSATYTNLPVGHYSFEVYGSNHSGHFGGKPLNLQLVVEPPWWATRTMKAVYVALSLAIGLILIAALRARKARERFHQRQLRERESRLSMALWGSGDEFWDLDLLQGRLYRLGAEQILGKGTPPTIDFNDWCNYVLHPDDLAHVKMDIAACLDGEVEHYESEYRLKTTQGKWIWVLGRGKIVERGPEGKPIRLSGTLRNITHQRDQDHDRRIATEVIRSMSEAVTVADLGFTFASVNAAFTRMTGYTNKEVRGRNTSILNCIQQADSVYTHMRRELETHGHWRGELWQRRKNGSDFLCWIELREVCNAHGTRTHYVGVMTDITDRKRAEQELLYLANYDMLTGLPNRTLLSERLSDAILRARRNNGRLALLYVDLDRFKHINDSMGHSTGDRLLKAAGARLRQCIREQDTVARVGGDEFTLVLEDIGGSGDVIGVAHKIIGAFNDALVLDTHQEVLISPSIGISLYPDHGQVPNELLKHADTAMYQAKERGRNTWMIYNDDMDADARLRATMAGALRRALEHDEMHVVYQPKMDLDSREVVGVEALVRWNNDKLGEVPPGIFIPLAEETGVIMKIGQFVLERACLDLRTWRAAGLDTMSMAVNLSMVQLQRSGLAKNLQHMLRDYDIPAQFMELELTESTVMANVEQSMRTLGELRAIGVNLAIDDFGTGYSSLAYLKRLPLNALKIDQAFVGDITTDPDDEAITATIITMAHSLGLQVVAEGVEIAEQAEYLKAHDCDLIQGNWLSRPLKSESCMEFCLQHAKLVKAAKSTSQP
ncbi:EAL domain-containing protein [Oleiagrimonas sp.]|uniref:EAL domain-containing protein n=1 Tax=Oleiagrimonas sp. TaxID=2010330 RepID=UPI00261AFC5A|nr:EAL domain-containing protein [Oleiagrimonas sp.]MDA3913628.1 EAL domain-containing protein [Oleiagrimonas sp.]